MLFRSKKEVAEQRELMQEAGIPGTGTNAGANDYVEKEEEEDE